jgi:hypothetical protein
MLKVPGFTAEQTLTASRFLYHAGGRRQPLHWSRLLPMQETSNYDTSGGQDEGDPGSVAPPDDTPPDTTDDTPLSGYDAGVPYCRCNICKGCQYQDGSYTCTGGFVVTAIPCGQRCGNNPCDQGT